MFNLVFSVLKSNIMKKFIGRGAMKYLVIIGFVITFISLKICMSEIVALHSRVQKLENPNYIDNIPVTKNLKEDIKHFQKCVDQCG